MSREGPWRFVFYCELVIYQDNFVIFVTAGIDNMELRDRVFLMAKKNKKCVAYRPAGKSREIQMKLKHGKVVSLTSCSLEQRK